MVEKQRIGRLYVGDLIFESDEMDSRATRLGLVAKTEPLSVSAA